MSDRQYIIGIDLGTTNSVLAYCRAGAEEAEIELLPIPQLTAAATIENRTTLPSFLYLARDKEGPSLGLPWGDGAKHAVGHWARDLASEQPERTVGAAKSWLAHSRVDRHSPILPFGSSDELPKISPVEAAKRYLEHLVAAWNQAMPDAPLADQQVVLTVPASFDASARELTRDAAQRAGLPNDFLLLEEPQAAVYSWLTEQGDSWRETLGVGDSLLVCDVGGGTTDLTLVEVAEDDGELTLRRRAVGNHLLVGGDNMDLALAHFVAGKFEQIGTKLDPWQSVSLWHSCRNAKEAILAPGGPETQTISVLGRGSKLIGGTVSVEINREEVAELLVNGFFPKSELSERPSKTIQSGFQQIGLPYESDTAVTRHLAAFLADHGEQSTGPVAPTYILFNGGVFKAEMLHGRLLETMDHWFADRESVPRPLAGRHDLDHATARGAAYYGWSKNSGGIRIRGGTAHSYYIGIETTGPAIPGIPRPLSGLCVVSAGMEEGTETDVPSDEFGLIVGQPATFRFFRSSIRDQDRPGQLIQNWQDDELIETDPLSATLEPDDSVDGSCVPVKFHAKITELGVFELWCVATGSDQRWKLEFSVRAS
jgi:Hsp70 protein